MFVEKSKEVEDLKITIRKMRDDQEKFKSEINDINTEIKKLEKTEKLFSDDLNKNKKSFRKLIEEFGFIDEFEKEIKNINRNHQANPNAMIVDEEANQGGNQEEAEEEQVGAVDRTSKVRKGPNNYAKYIDPKYIDYNFKMEELEELSHSIVNLILILLILKIFLERNCL